MTLLWMAITDAETKEARLVPWKGGKRLPGGSV
jgi:hypothetical protein